MRNIPEEGILQLRSFPVQIPVDILCLFPEFYLSHQTNPQTTDFIEIS
jgi:hypothetical protein